MSSEYREYTGDEQRLMAENKRLREALDKQLEDHQADVELLCKECMSKVLERAGFTRENVAEFVQTVKDTVNAALAQSASDGSGTGSNETAEQGEQ